MEQLNDIAFVLDGRLIVLVEHQSTINNNMPLRMFQYLASEYQLITDRKNLYKQGRVKIPAPEFIVLYNGDKKFPDFKELKLSDSYNFKTPECYLELVVKVYNINKGCNAEIASRSPVLSGYEEFISEIKKNLEIMELREAIRLAIKTCISKNILVSFLERNGSEVENMLLTEWNMDDTLAVAREESLEEGMRKILEYLKQGHSVDEAEKLLATLT
jgi:hypothetical protein